MNFFNRLRETLTHLDNALDNATRPQAGRPVFAIIDTETTGFNKRYDRIIELAVARFDESFRLVDQWHTRLTHTSPPADKNRPIRVSIMRELGKSLFGGACTPI